jgi:ABC-type polar amino acid transport system ATPase subunit
MSQTSVSVRGLRLRRGTRDILAGVDFDVERGEVIALMGASGSGKTTILRALAGLEPFERGSVTVEGVSVPEGPPSDAAIRNLRQKVGMVFQFHCLFEHLAALHNVTLALVHVHRMARVEAERRAHELLNALGVEHRATALPRELSGGEAQRVAIARALATDPPVLLMDEPTASLDPSRRLELASLVRSLAGRHRTLLIATHDEDFASAAAGRVLHMQEGRIVESAGSDAGGPSAGA